MVQAEYASHSIPQTAPTPTPAIKGHSEEASKNHGGKGNGLAGPNCSSTITPVVKIEQDSSGGVEIWCNDGVPERVQRVRKVSPAQHMCADKV